MLPLGATFGAAVLAWGFNAHPTQSAHGRALTVGHAHVNSGGAGGAGLESGEPLICDPGGKGLLLPLFVSENDLPKGPRVFLYLGMLLWCFLGVAIVADVFMAAIERITSSEKKVIMTVKGVQKPYFVRVWNPTIANLTLMALGSSAPEILLSVIELFSGQMYSGELGPSTIVGSAAFNLLMILAICVVAVPEPQLRRIDSLGVYTCTATGSVLAYVWLVFILQVSSPDIITPLEGVATFGAFFVLVALAYLLDIGFFSAAAAKKREKELMQNAQVLEVTGDGEEGERQPHPALVARAIREVQGVFDETAADSDAFKEAVKAKISELQPRSRAYGRRGARTLGAARARARARPHTSHPLPAPPPAAAGTTASTPRRRCAAAGSTPATCSAPAAASTARATGTHCSKRARRRAATTRRRCSCSLAPPITR